MNLRPLRTPLIIINLIVLAYALFFTLAVCGAFPTMSVSFGGCLGDLLPTFIMVVVLLVFAFGLMVCILSLRAHPAWLVALLALCLVPMISLHLQAVQGNYRGHRSGQSCEWGLYYNRPQLIFDEALARAKQGNSQAQEYVGQYYYTGYGVRPNKTEALRWYRLAAAQGGGYSQYFFGMQLLNGHDVDQDSVEAFEWITIAAQYDIEEAQTLLQQHGRTWQE